MKPDIVHKIRYCQALCGCAFDMARDTWSGRWDRVNCPDCLSKRKKVKVPAPFFAVAALKVLRQISRRLQPCKHPGSRVYPLGDAHEWCRICGAFRVLNSDGKAFGQWIPPLHSPLHPPKTKT